MQFHRLNLHDSPEAIRSSPIGLFRQECHRVTLIEQTEFTFRVHTAFRIDINTSFDHVAMEI